MNDIKQMTYESLSIDKIVYNNGIDISNSILIDKLKKHIETQTRIILIQDDENKEIITALNILENIINKLKKLESILNNFEDNRNSVKKIFLKILGKTNEGHFLDSINDISNFLRKEGENIKYQIDVLVNSVRYLEKNIFLLNQRINFYNKAIKHINVNDIQDRISLISDIKKEIDKISIIKTNTIRLVDKSTSIKNEVSQKYKDLQISLDTLTPLITQTISLKKVGDFGEHVGESSDKLFKLAFENILSLKKANSSSEKEKILRKLGKNNID